MHKEDPESEINKSSMMGILSYNTPAYLNTTEIAHNRPQSPDIKRKLTNPDSAA